MQDYYERRYVVRDSISHVELAASPNLLKHRYESMLRKAVNEFFYKEFGNTIGQRRTALTIIPGIIVRNNPDPSSFLLEKEIIAFIDVLGKTPIIPDTLVSCDMCGAIFNAKSRACINCGREL